VLTAALHAKVEKVVHTSTSEVYGTARYAPIDESHPLQGQSPYSASKIGADALAYSYHCAFQLPVATLRPFNTYGPRQSTRAVIPTIITQALKNQPVRLGSLSPRRDLTFVADTVAGFIKIAESSNAVGEVVNIGSNHEITIGELAKLILEIMGVKSEIVTDESRHRPGKSEVERLLASTQKASDLIGWKPEVSLREGLTRTIAWITDHQAQYNTNIYHV
jgi:nucleoside-diphosphate-sugar epimerase